jgi:hypothetical protein
MTLTFRRNVSMKKLTVALMCALLGMGIRNALPG